MKPAAFEYVAAASLDEAISALAGSDGEGKVIAGGQSLVPLLNMRLARPALLVDLNRVAGLDGIREENGSVVIGALTRQRDVELSALVAERQPLLHAATRFIAHPQIRNRGTVGGSIAHADPAAEYPAVAIALGAEMTVRGPDGARQVSAEDFFVSYLTTCLDTAEVLTEVRFPALPAGAGWGFVEFARRAGDFALAGAAVTLESDSGAIKNPRIALFGVGPTPFRATATEQLLAGERPNNTLIEAAGNKAYDEVEDPLSDVHASADYRKHLAGVMVRRALKQAIERMAS
ncbi:MAG: xanthine dehydrogenase family protein subunit M [Deltaproteobacteria bacterium]|nr:MAG: xanthine dehydrogenase family protein subunit M [Deltaproteobacteria bacterium]